MEVATAVHAIKQRWLAVALITAMMAGAAGVFGLLSPPSYTATADGLLTVTSPETRPPYALANGSQYILDRMTSYAQLGKTTPVLEPVVRDLNLQETALTLSGRVKAKSLADRAVLEVSAQYSDPAVAARVADATLVQMGRAISRIENGNIKMTAVGPATVPDGASNLTVLIFVAVGMVAGLVFGIAAAVGLEVLRERGGWRTLRPQA